MKENNDNYMSYAALNASIIVFMLFLVFLVVYTTCPSRVRSHILPTFCFLALAFIVIFIDRYVEVTCVTDIFHRWYKTIEPPFYFSLSIFSTEFQDNVFGVL